MRLERFLEADSGVGAQGVWQQSDKDSIDARQDVGFDVNVETVRALTAVVFRVRLRALLASNWLSSRRLNHVSAMNACAVSAKFGCRQHCDTWVALPR